MDKPPKRRLYELYWKRDEPIAPIAKRYTVSTKTVRRWFREYGIKRVPPNQRAGFIFCQRNKGWLYQEYWGKDKSINEIAAEHGIRDKVVGAQLDAYGIQRKPRGADSYVFHQLRKRRLYELYWGEHKHTVTIGEQYNVGRKVVRERLREYGIPRAHSGNHQAFIFAMRSKRYYYELYWGERLNYADIASRLNLGTSFVGEQIRAAGVPTRDDPYPTGDPDEIPQRYEWPDSEPATLNSDDPTADLPDNPDGSKYVPDETRICFEKDRLYELYWEYGLALTHLAARLDVSGTTLRDKFNEYGIPIREWYAHTKWEPHHGVPPKYEWPDDRNVDDEEPNIQNGIWRQPASGD